MLTLPHLGDLERDNWKLGATLRSVMEAINQHGTTVGVDPTGVFPAPAAPSQLQVTSVAGGFDVAIVDVNPQRAVNYFVEFDTSASFGVNPRTVPLHTTRNIYLPLGTATYFFRCYSQFQGSDASGYTYFGAPTGVAGGAAGTPTLGPTQGTGAGSTTGASPQPPVGQGFGPLTRQPAPRNLPGGRNTF